MLEFSKSTDFFCRAGTGDGKDAFARLLPPVYTEAEAQTDTLVCTGESESTATYAGGGFTAADAVTPLGRGLFTVTRSIRNTSDSTRTVKWIVTLRDSFRRHYWTIPCVSFGGNVYGDGKYPQGFTYAGQPWIYDYHRTGIPACSLAEDERRVTALFASDRDELSLTTSVSVTENADGSLDHKIYYPITEAPYSYTNTNTLTARVDTWLTFAPGEEKTFTFHVFLGEPRWKNFGMAALLDRLTDFYRFDDLPTVPAQVLHDVGIRYIESLVRDYGGRRMFASARRADYGAPAFPAPAASFEIGWAGQGALNAQIFIEEYFATGKKQYLDDALSYLDAWCEKQDENGLFLAHYEWYPKPGEPAWRPAQSDTKIIANFHVQGGVENKGKGWYPETCNLGWGAAQMARCYALLAAHGIEKPEYLTFAKRTCDFFVRHFDAENGFGKSWRFDGTAFDATGTAGGFILPALIEVWRITKDDTYLDLAKRGLAFYIKRDVDEFACTAGAIDCACVDKETVYPLLLTALDLYDLTGEAQYAEWAEKCGYYFYAWAYHYDALYPTCSDFTRYGYHTRGGTAVSAQHHAIDSWGSLFVPEFIRLQKITGDRRWFLRARELWHNATLCIATEEGYVINGTVRPIGGQNEAFFQCRWTRYRPSPDEIGHFNNWLISWVNAYRLSAIRKLGTEAEVFRTAASLQPENH